MGSFENPKANIRAGDDDKLQEKFKEHNLEIVNHPFGYRSLHYLIKSKPDKQEVVAEIQVRTIFEEGWSEIDHRIRYPYDTDNPILKYYLVLFNRLAGNADEMGSFVRFLTNELDQINNLHQKELHEKNATITELELMINALKIEGDEKEELKKTIKTLRSQLTKSINSSSLSNPTTAWPYVGSIGNSETNSTFGIIGNINESAFKLGITAEVQEQMLNLSKLGSGIKIK